MSHNVERAFGDSGDTCNNRRKIITNNHHNCEICGNKIEGKPLCLWDAIDCFHRTKKCVPSCKVCYSTASGIRDRFQRLDFRRIRQAILEQLKECPNCGTKNHKREFFCVKCGTRFIDTYG